MMDGAFPPEGRLNSTHQRQEDRSYYMSMNSVILAS